MEAIEKNKIWSNMYDTKEVQDEIKDIKKKLRKKAFLMLTITPLVGLIFGILMQIFEFDEMKWWGGLILSFPLELIFIYNIIRKFLLTKKRPIEGTVIKKRTYRKSKRSFLTSFFFGRRESGNRYDPGNYNNIYEIKIKLINGEKRKIKYKEDITYYDYVKVNDQIKYYPFFNTLEKYDKSKSNVTYCIVCGEENPIVNVKCTCCGHRLYDVVDKNAINETAMQLVKDGVWHGEKVTMAKLRTTNYENNEEVGEAYYDNGWDIDDPSWQCDCGFWNESKKCNNCGNLKQ